MVFTTAQKVTKYLGYFSNFICCQEIPKIAQSRRNGHTSMEGATFPFYDRFHLHFVHFVVHERFVSIQNNGIKYFYDRAMVRLRW